MVGVDHTSGTDTKVETTDKPQASDTAYQPPPDRPGSPGQPSRAESRAAARAPAETEGEPMSEASFEGTERQDELQSGESSTEETDGPGTDKPQVEGAADQETTETGRPEDVQGVVERGPRAESRARAIETWEASAEGSGADSSAELPTRADLDPVSAGELTRERGEPLTPINENQDLREPDPERDSDWKKALRKLDDNLEDVSKEFTKFNDNAQKVLDHRPPSEHLSGVQQDKPHLEGAPNDTINGPSIGMGIVAAAMVGIVVKRGAVDGFNRIFRRNNGDNG